MGVARGLEPLPSTPLTPWSEWENLFNSIDEDHLPPVTSKRSTTVVSERERRHDEILRTYSNSNLAGLVGPGRRQHKSSVVGSRSEMSLLDLAGSSTRQLLL